MAYDYNKAKQAWEMMDDNQKKQYTEQNKNDANFQQFAQQYHNENYDNGSSSSNGSVNQNNTVNNTQGTNTQPTTQSNQNQTNQNGSTYDFSNNHSTLSDGRNGNGNFYGNTQFDREEQFDKSMIGDTKGVTIQEGTGKDTGRPDYQIDTDARLNEMRNNLNQYYQTNPEWFQDRETFNRQFEYNQRESDAQRALLDSYWKKAQDMRTVNNYTNGDSVMAGFNSYDITPDQMSLLRQYNPEAYAQWQKQMQDELNARITNMAAPRDIWSTVDLWGEIVKKFGLEAGDPYDIYGTWYNMAEQLGVFRDSQQLESMSNNIASIYSTMNSNVQNISSQLEGRYSAGYIEARINKANSRLNSQASSMQYSYNLLLQKRNQNMAIAQQAGAMKQAQGQEDSRVFNNKLQALGFAMKADSYRTPEQQAQLQLQTQQIQNDMSLLNQSKLNDLSLYNQYATAKLQNQLNSELTDLSVTDPAQQRANLNNVLDDYYSQYGDIIKRSKSEVIDDVLAQAKAEGISVAEALRKNFIEPLMSKPEYKNAIRNSYGLGAEIQKIGDTLVGITYDDNGIPQVHNLGYYGDTPVVQNTTNTSNVAGSAWSNGNQTKLGETAVDTGIANVYGSTVKLAPTVGNMLQNAVNDLKSKGIDLQIGDSYRSYETQKASYEKDQALPANQRKGVAAPGKSFHEIGQAIDIAQSQMNDPTVIQALLNAGFTRPVKSEPRHWSYGEGADAFGGVSNKVTYDPSQGAMYAKFLDGYVPNGPAQEWIRQMGIEPSTVMAQAEAWKHDHQKQYINPMLNTIESLIGNYNSNYALWGSTGAKGSMGMSEGFNDFISDYYYLKDNLTLTHLTELKEQGATFGALSDNELNAIGNSATSLRLGGSKDKYENNLLTIYNNFLSSAGLPSITLDELKARSGSTDTTSKNGMGVNLPSYLAEQQLAPSINEYSGYTDFTGMWNKG